MLSLLTEHWRFNLDRTVYPDLPYDDRLYEEVSQCIPLTLSPRLASPMLSSSGTSSANTGELCIGWFISRVLAAIGTTLVVRELATDSVKHCALSDEAGSVDISSAFEDDDVRPIWGDTGGSIVEELAALNGYYSKMVARTVVSQLHSAIGYDWQQSGFVMMLRMKKDRLSN